VNPRYLTAAQFDQRLLSDDFRRPDAGAPWELDPGFASRFLPNNRNGLRLPGYSPVIGRSSYGGPVRAAGPKGGG
jgi:hypothetical protein